jgi:predicted DNA-binding WGR domain protein
MELRSYTRYGEKKAGTNNKFYEVTADEQEEGGRATWEFRWGRIGTTGQCKNGTTYSFEEAKRLCKMQFGKKEQRGYREVTAMEALASAAEAPEERPNNGLSKVEIDIPCFHAGKSEKRCQQFCRKYIDKLNVIRASKWALGDAYSTQIETLLKQYCAEFKRMQGTKVHGHLAENVHAHTAFRIFFGLLKDNAGCGVYGFFEGVGTAY